METEELTNELIHFLNDRGLYYLFLDWTEERGFDRNELEKKIEEVQDEQFNSYKFV